MGSVSFAFFLWVDNNPISDYNTFNPISDKNKQMQRCSYRRKAIWKRKAENLLRRLHCTIS